MIKWVHLREVTKQCPKCGKQMHLANNLRGRKGFYYLHDDFEQHILHCNYREAVDTETALTLAKGV